jgi:hypothetical protein
MDELHDHPTDSERNSISWVISFQCLDEFYVHFGLTVRLGLQYGRIYRPLKQNLIVQLEVESHVSRSTPIGH